MTALRALRLSVARAAEDEFGLALAVSGGRQSRVLPDELDPLMSDKDLLIVLDRPGGMTGAASLSLPLVAALIQQQTTGRVSDRPIEPRPYTDTDAALVAPLLDGVLSRACDLAEAEADRSCFRSIRFGARAEDARSLILTLRAARYRVFSLPLDIALGRHQATMSLVLPVDPDSDTDRTSEEVDPDERAANSPFLNVETELRAVLARFRMPVSDLNALAVGDMLPLPRERLDDTSLVTLANRVVARGKLGQMNGHRAIRLMAHLPVPKVGHPIGFDPQITKSADERLHDPTAYEQAHADAGVSDIDVSALGTLSTDEAVDQISTLAGLTPEDLAAMDGPAALAGDDDVQLPAVFSTSDPDGENLSTP